MIFEEVIKAKTNNNSPHLMAEHEEQNQAT